MSDAGPRLNSLNLWTKRERRCLAIVESALILLRQKQLRLSSEVDLNREFYFCLLTASRELYPNDELAPAAECNNQPDPDDQVRATREQKRPDFQWIYLDRYETDPRRSSRQFVVECKRLGTSIRTDWILNQNYTDHGIDRFHDIEWAYAKSVASGAMVGYWQSMEAADLLHDVLEEARKKSFPDLVLVGKWNTGAVTHFEHIFERSFEISPFQLHHMWIDLRQDSSTG